MREPGQGPRAYAESLIKNAPDAVVHPPIFEGKILQGQRRPSFALLRLSVRTS